jgi:hypothetical protein
MCNVMINGGMDSVDIVDEESRKASTNPHTTDLLSLLSDCVKYSFKKKKVTVHEEVQVNVTSVQHTAWSESSVSQIQKHKYKSSKTKKINPARRA